MTAVMQCHLRCTIFVGKLGERWMWTRSVTHTYRYGFFHRSFHRRWGEVRHRQKDDFFCGINSVSQHLTLFHFFFRFSTQCRDTMPASAARNIDEIRHFSWALLIVKYGLARWNSELCSHNLFRFRKWDDKFCGRSANGWARPYLVIIKFQMAIWEYEDETDCAARRVFRLSRLEEISVEQVDTS